MPARSRLPAGEVGVSFPVFRTPCSYRGCAVEPDFGYAGTPLPVPVLVGCAASAMRAAVGRVSARGLALRSPGDADQVALGVGEVRWPVGPAVSRPAFRRVCLV